MSCITEILKLKGNNEILRIPLNSGIVIEDGGIYRNYEYLITFNKMGFRCGYIAIPPDHPLNQSKEDYPQYHIHGGVTFFEENHFYFPDGHKCTDKWIGFDAAHGTDGRDIETALKYFTCLRKIEIEAMESMSKIGTVKTREYMIAQCRYLIDQIQENS